MKNFASRFMGFFTKQNKVAEPNNELGYLLDEVYRCNADSLAFIQMAAKAPLTPEQSKVLRVNRQAMPRLMQRIDMLGSR